MNRITMSMIALGAALYLSTPSYAMPSLASTTDITQVKKCPVYTSCGVKICPPVPIPGRDCIILNADINREIH